MAQNGIALKQRYSRRALRLKPHFNFNANGTTKIVPSEAHPATRLMDQQTDCARELHALGDSRDPRATMRFSS